MGVRILYDETADQAVLYCSTSDWAFGPVFSRGGPGDQTAIERAEAFLVWLATDAEYGKYEKTQIGIRRDARLLTDSGLQAAYSDWLRAEEQPRLMLADEDETVPS